MKLFRTLIFLLAVCGIITPCSAQELLSAKERNNVVKEITGNYKNWNAAAWQAGVKADVLPLTVTMKVYMKRGELTMISLRAPIMGEVVRIEVDKEKVLFINKMKKRYWEKPIAEIDSILPDAQQTLQSLLLGRVVIIGSGELSKKNVSMTDIYEMPDGGLLIVPNLPEELESGAYGYAVNNAGEITDIVLTGGGNEVTGKKIGNMSMAVDVEYGSRGDADAIVSLNYDKINLNATIDAGAIEWGAKPFARFNLTNSYKKSSLKDCIKF